MKTVGGRIGSGLSAFAENRRPSLAGAGRGVAQAAGEVACDLVRVGDEVATALVALGHG